MTERERESRTLALWDGGVYSCIKLISPTDADVREKLADKRQLWTRVLLLEEAMAQEVPPAGVPAFADLYLWNEGQVYRELMTMLLENSWK